MYASCASERAWAACTSLFIERYIEALMVEAQCLLPLRHVDAEVLRGIIMHAVLAALVVGQPGAHVLLRLDAKLALCNLVDVSDRCDRVGHQRPELHIDETFVIRRAIPVDPPQQSF